jgi:hypothetical protein
MTDRLELLADQLIARGWHRECYQHPTDKNLCVKVVVNGDDTETKREQAYYRHLEGRLSDWQSIPKFHGQVDTNLGNGAVFSLIRDADGEVSKTLGYYLSSPELFSLHRVELQESLQRLYHYQLKNNVITMSLKPNNLLFQLHETGQGTMFIIDNLGNAELLPVSTYSRFFGARKIQRKWTKFKSALSKQYSNLTLLAESLDKLP